MPPKPHSVEEGFALIHDLLGFNRNIKILILIVVIALFFSLRKDEAPPNVKDLAVVRRNLSVDENAFPLLEQAGRQEPARFLAAGLQLEPSPGAVGGRPELAMVEAGAGGALRDPRISYNFV